MYFVSQGRITLIEIQLANETKVEATIAVVVDIYMEKLDGSDSESGQYTRLSLQNVLLVPEVAISVISCSRLDQCDLTTTIAHDMCVISDRKKQDRSIGYAVVRHGDNLFEIAGEAIPNPAEHTIRSAVTSSSYLSQHDAVQLWYRRLGHISESIVCATSKNALDGVDLSKPPKSIHCDTCTTGKNTKVASSGTLFKGECLLAIHVDMCKPFRLQTFSKAIYFIYFIVEHFQFAEVSLLRLKSESLKKFQEFSVFSIGKRNICWLRSLRQCPVI